MTGQSVNQKLWLQDALDSGHVGPGLQPFPRCREFGGHRAERPRRGEGVVGEQVLQACTSVAVGDVQQLLPVGLQDVEGDVVGRQAGGEGGGGAGAGGGPALQSLEAERARLGIPHQQLAVEDQADGQLLGGRRDEVGEAVLDRETRWL